jgi:hypothetical protein
MPTTLLRGGDRAGQSGLMLRRYLHPDGQGLCLPGVDHGLGQRAALAWGLSNTLDADFCVEALEEALSRYRRPEIFNTDEAASSPVTTLPGP